jgi:aconitate hydratase
MEVNHRDGSKDVLKLTHTYSDSQIEWFKAGSALNLIRQK